MQQSKLEIAKDVEQQDLVRQETTEVLSFFPFLLRRLLHFFDYVAVLRPILLIPGWTMLFLGYYKGLTHNSTNHISLPLIGNLPIILRPDGKMLATLFLYSLLMGAIYIINQIIDSRTDEINGKLYLVAQGYVKNSSLKIQIVILLAVAILIAFVKFPLIYSYFILSSIALGIMYSVPPIRLKGKAFLDLFSHALGFGFIAFAVGWMSGSAFSMDLIYKCVPYAICVSAAFINTTIPDMDGDIQNGDNTIGAFLGFRKSCIASTLLLATVPLISWHLKDFISFVASTFSLPFFLYMTVLNWNVKTPNIPAITLATKVSLLVLSLLIALLIPFYFALLIPVILLMRLYYKARFGIKYP